MLATILLTLRLAAAPAADIPPHVLFGCEESSVEPPVAILSLTPAMERHVERPASFGFGIAELGVGTAAALGSELGIALVTVAVLAILPPPPPPTGCSTFAPCGLFAITPLAEITLLVGLLAELMLPPVLTALADVGFANWGAHSHSLLGGILGGLAGTGVAVLAALWFFPPLLLATPLLVGAGVTIGMNIVAPREEEQAAPHSWTTLPSAAPTSHVALFQF